jgi:hypothetical protein
MTVMKIINDETDNGSSINEMVVMWRRNVLIMKMIFSGSNDIP